MLKLRDDIDIADPNAIDSLWREFFLSENQIVLSEALCKEASRFLSLCQKYKLVANDISDEQVIKRLNYFDISDSAKFASWNFVTNYQNANGKAKRLSISKMFMSALADSKQVWSDENIKELKLESYRALEFENIAATILLYRNRYSHWHHPINDLGHVIKLVATIIRFFEIFGDHGYLNIDTKLIKRRFFILSEFFKEDHIDEDEKIRVVVNESSVNATPIENANKDLQSIEQIEQSDDPQISLPQVEEGLKQSEEQIQQALLRLRGRIIKQGQLDGYSINRKECILSRQIISELLIVKPKNKADFRNSPTFRILSSKNIASYAWQFDRYHEEILSTINQ